MNLRKPLIANSVKICITGLAGMLNKSRAADIHQYVSIVVSCSFLAVV